MASFYSIFRKFHLNNIEITAEMQFLSSPLLFEDHRVEKNIRIYEYPLPL